MRRIVVIATALAVLVAAAAAYAATCGLNSYSANLKFSPNKASKGSAAAYTQTYHADGTNGNRTAPLSDIKTVIYGLKPDGKDFPTCSLAKIANAKSDTGCPKGALVATGRIEATLGPENDQSAASTQTQPCTPLLHAWNGGQGKIVFFFVDQAPGHLCAGGAVPTGFVGPFLGTAKFLSKSKNLVQDTPIPASVSFPLAGTEGSLTFETLSWKNLTKKLKNGKTVAYYSSVACKGGKRPYSVSFTAGVPGSPSETQTVTGTQKCS